jgi:hypothetical protein
MRNFRAATTLTLTVSPSATIRLPHSASLRPGAGGTACPRCPPGVPARGAEEEDEGPPLQGEFRADQDHDGEWKRRHGRGICRVAASFNSAAQARGRRSAAEAASSAAAASSTRGWGACAGPALAGSWPTCPARLQPLGDCRRPRNPGHVSRRPHALRRVKLRAPSNKDDWVPSAVLTGSLTFPEPVERRLNSEPFGFSSRREGTTFESFGRKGVRPESSRPLDPLELISLADPKDIVIRPFAGL